MHSPFGTGWRIREQIFEQLASLGAMIIAIKFDVAIDVIYKMT